jgi:hypothetical protein
MALSKGGGNYELSCALRGVKLKVQKPPSDDGWDRLAAVRLPSGLAPDHVVLTARRRAQASVEGELQKGVYCVYYVG